MDIHTPKFNMRDIPPEDRAFYIEMAAAAALATALILIV